MRTSRVYSLLFLRVSIGLLMLIWGIDKIANTAHSVGVAERFYFGIGANAVIMPALGVAQIVFAVLVIVGAMRRVVYPVMLVIAGVTLLSVWRSIVDPWGWVLDGTNALFFPSLIVFAGALVLQAFRDDDRLALDRRRDERFHSTAGV